MDGTCLALKSFVRAKRWSEEMFGYRSKMKKRQPIELDDLFERYFSQSNSDFEEFVSIWTELSETLSVPPKLMRPNDVLKDMAGQGMISPRIENLSDFALQRAKNHDRQVEFEKIVSVHDYVVQLSAQ